MLTTAQVAQLLHITPKQVLLYVQDGRIKAHRLPGMRQYLFWRKDIYDLIEASVVKPEEAEAVAQADKPARARTRRS